MASLPTPLALSTPPMAATSPSLPLTTITSLSAIGISDGGAASRLAAFPITGLASPVGPCWAKADHSRLADQKAAAASTIPSHDTPSRIAAAPSSSRLVSISIVVVVVKWWFGSS